MRLSRWIVVAVIVVTAACVRAATNVRAPLGATLSSGASTGGPIPLRFDPNAKVTKQTNYRQLYVIFEAKDGQYYMTLVGPAKTIEKHKKTFEEWVKNFK